jgi:hypothetical protein
MTCMHAGTKLTAESAFYWRVLAKHAVEKDDDELMEAALPEIAPFCDMLRHANTYACVYVHVYVMHIYVIHIHIGSESVFL